MQRIQLVLAPGLLRQDAAHAVQQVLRFAPCLLWKLSELAADLAVNDAHPAPERLEGFAHALKLLGMRVAADLRGHTRSLSVVVLAQLQMVFISELDQVLAAFLQQSTIGGWAMTLGMTVVSTMTLSRLLFLIRPAARAASMVTASKTSTPSSPMRFLQRLKLEGSMGSAVCKQASAQKYCQ